MHTQPKIEVMLREYDTLREEALALAAHIKSRVGNLQLLGAGAVAVVAAYASGNVHLQISKDNFDIWVWATLVLTAVVNYLIFDVVSPYYWLSCGAARLAQIEARVNELIEERVLVWESAATPSFRKGMPGIPNPDLLLSAFFFLIYVLVLLILPGVVAYKLWVLPDLANSCGARLGALTLVVLVYGSAAATLYSLWRVMNWSRPAADSRLAVILGRGQQSSPESHQHE